MSQAYLATGSYTTAFFVFAPMIGVAAVMACFAGPYRYPVSHHRPPASAE